MVITGGHCKKSELCHAYAICGNVNAILWFSNCAILWSVILQKFVMPLVENGYVVCYTVCDF